MTQPNAEDVPLETFEEIDEDPPPDPPPELGELGNVDVAPSELEMGTIDPARTTATKPPTMGIVTPPPPPQPLGYREPWVSFDTTPGAEPSEPPDLEAIKAYYAALRDALTLKIAEAESQLGFISEAADLAVRVSKIELFLGIKS